MLIDMIYKNNIIPKNPAAINSNNSLHVLFNPAIPNIVNKNRRMSNARNNSPILLQVLRIVLK